MNYNGMPAGREMDALVAEKVMGLEVSRDHYGGPRHLVRTGAKWRYDVIEAYSTKISSAWEVVEKMIHLDPMIDWWGSHWDCVLRRQEGSCEEYTASAPTAPLAICRAALNAAETGEEE